MNVRSNFTAVVEYNGQKVTVSKYYPRAGESLFGQSTNMGLLTPCIGSIVGAVVDDGNGEILSLTCTSGTPVIVVPDTFIRIR
jgi:hypothetical protein